MWWWNSRRTTTFLVYCLLIGCCCCCCKFSCLRSGDNRVLSSSSIYAWKKLGWLIGSMLLLPGCLLLLLPLSFSRRCRLLGTIGRSSPTPCAWPWSSSSSLSLEYYEYSTTYDMVQLFGVVAHCVREYGMVSSMHFAVIEKS